MIEYVKFRDPVSIGTREFNEIPSWDRAKHGKAIKLFERGPFFVLEIEGRGRRRVPMSNVSFISEDGEDEQRKDGGGGGKGKP